MHDASPALAGVAADMRASEPKTFPQELYKQQARLDICRNSLPIHGHRDGNHPCLPKKRTLDLRETRGVAARLPPSGLKDFSDSIHDVGRRLVDIVDDGLDFRTPRGIEV
jgi:hypothetical protein